MSARVMILGLDGASWRLTQRLVAEGRMPTLRRMIEEGAAGPLYSTLPDISPTAWASFMTGKNPGQHGVYGFGLKIPGSYYLEPFSSRGRVEASTLWRILSARGQRVAVINVPMTYPPEPVNGIMIAGFGTPDESESRFVYPLELMDELRAKLGPYILDLDWALYEKRGITALLEDARRMTRRRADYGLHILGREAWDLFALVFVSTDRLQHCLWQYLDPHEPRSAEQQQIRASVLDYYDYLDGVLGEFLAASREATVLVMSDHGFGPFQTTIQLNSWLAEQGFLTWETENRAQLRWAVRLARSLGMTRESFGRLARLLRFNEYQQLEKVSLRANNIRWAQTRAFSYTPNGIYFNLKGRERDGTVEPGADCDRLFEQLKELLLDLRDPETGNRMVRRVARPQEVYHGQKVALAPDLIVADSDPSYTLNFNLSPTAQVFEYPSWRSGNHDPEGLLVAYGPRVARGRRLERADLVDLCPTALHLLGEAVPDDMDGHAITEILSVTERVAVAPTSAEPSALEFGPVMTDEDQEKVFERLKGLGYLE